MAAVVKLHDVWAMLEDCAKGYAKTEKQHHWHVSFNGKTFRSLPLGEHGRRKKPEIESGHVRGMIRHLAISLDCAKKHLNL